MYNQIKGSQGEEIAVKYLLAKKYEILDRNFRTNEGEIDIIAKKNDSIIFIEVKTRKSNTWIDLIDNVSDNKIRKIERTAEAWLELRNFQETFWQIDFIGIILKSKSDTPQIEHLEDI